MENYNCPADVGKLPQKFSTSFGSFNADQLKNWTLLFSMYCLNGILPECHLKCWRKFVLACKMILCEMSHDRGTLGEINRIPKPSVLAMSSRLFVVHEGIWDETDGVLMPILKPNTLNDDELDILSEFYKSLKQENFVVCTSVQEGKELYLNGSILGSKHSRSVRSSYIMAFWADDDGRIISKVTNHDLTPKPGQIESFLKHSILDKEKTRSYYLAKVRWFKRLPDTLRNHYGKPLEVWSSNLYVQRGQATYIPVHRIKCRFVFVKTILDNKEVMVTSPREQYIV
ncbi:hypothetical protein KUTeg_023700 [Tegillarca granosa]|uniref:Uncharacterized protein n=1 Tax=Tegillarca granosa TaxID=220873 RepID=A0ABQ9E804_TEGGR|nr:hypothetical protein KUTeg_023700 [Tegillarca granosa]